METDNEARKRHAVEVGDSEEDEGDEGRKQARVTHRGGGGAGGAPGPGSATQELDASMPPFKLILHNAGLTISAEGQYRAQSTALVSQQLRRKLQHSPASLEDFIKGLEDHLEDEGNLRKSLLPIVAGSSSTHPGVPQDPLIRLLLGVPDVQPRLVQMLFDKIPCCFDEDSEDCKASESLPRLFLAQLRWMEYTCDESEITKKLIELIEIAPLFLKREIISALPDIVQDRDYFDVVQCLSQVIESNTECINAVLDTLSSLSLHPEMALLCDITDIIVNRLDSAAPADLPVMVRYLLQASSGDKLSEVIHALRASISFIASSSSDEDAALGAVRFSQAAGAGGRRGEVEMLTLEAVVSGIKFRKQVVDKLIHEVSAVRRADDHLPFDIWALVLIRACGDAKRQAEVDRVFKQKVRGKLLSKSLMRSALVRHADALKPYFREFRSLANLCMVSHDIQLAGFGAQLYTLVFKEFADDCSRQEVLGDVMAHTGGGSAVEVDAALSVLEALVGEEGQLLRPFSPYIKGILEYIENLQSKAHIRSLFRIVSRLATGGGGADAGENRLDDDVHNKIRKLLQSPEAKFFKRGIIGALSAVIVLSSLPKDAESQQSLESSGSDANPVKQATQATSLLDTIKANCARSDAATIFMFDELAAATAWATSQGVKIKASTLSWIEDNATEALESTYLADFEAEGPQRGISGVHSTLKVVRDLDLNNGEEDGGVVVNLFPMIESGSAEDAGKLHKMCALYRMLSVYYMAANGTLDAVDALLGCPIYLIDNCPVEEFDLLRDCEKQHYILSHFHAANWIIEALNAFATVEDAEMREKLVKRSNHLRDLLSIIDKSLAKQPFTLPDLNAASALAEPAPAKAGGARGRPKALGLSKVANKKKGNEAKAIAKGGKGKKGGKVKEKEDMEISEEEEEGDAGKSTADPQLTANSQVTAEGAAKDKKQAHHLAGMMSDLLHLREQAYCFRALSPEVHLVLRYEADMRNSGGSPRVLSPDAALGHFRDLQAKLDGVVASSTRKAFGFGAAGARQESAVADVPAFMKLLSDVCPAIVWNFKTLAASLCQEGETMEEEEEEDVAGRKERQMREETLEVLVGIVVKMLQCNDSVSVAEESPVAKVLHCLAAECPHDSALDVMDVDDEMQKDAVAFLEGFARALPTLKLTSAVGSLMLGVAGLVNRGEVNTRCSDFALWCLKHEKFRDVELPKLSKKDREDKVKVKNDLQARREAAVMVKESLSILVKAHVQLAQDPFECLDHMIEDVMQHIKVPIKKKKRASKPKKKSSTKEDDEDDEDDEDEDEEENEEDEEDKAPDFPMITKKHFLPFFKIFVEFAADRMTELERTAAQIKASDALPELLCSLSEVVSSFAELTKLIKDRKDAERNDMPVLSTMLKFGNRMVTSFLKITGVLGKYMKQHQEAINETVSKFQASTRTLQIICAHVKELSKEHKDPRMVNLVPKVKKNLELLLFKVKGMLHESGMGEAFQLGNLKNRTLQGQVVKERVREEEEEEEEGEGTADEKSDGEEGGEEDEEEEGRGEGAETEDDEDDAASVGN